MAVFSVLLSALLVAGQFTSIILDRRESAWGFYLMHARPDFALWRPALDRILSAASHPTFSNLTITTNNTFSNLTTTTTNTFSNHTTNTTNTSKEVAEVLLVGKRSGILLCLHAATTGSREEEEDEEGAYARRAYQCLLRAHTPALGVAVLDLFNPHLALLALCCLQFLICMARFECLRVKEPVPWRLPLPLWGFAIGLFLLLVAASAVQVVHAPELLQAPTVVFLLLWCALGAYYSLRLNHYNNTFDQDVPWELAFQLQAVAVPLALLAYASFGPRLWADLLTHACLLCAAVNLLWLQLHKGTPVWLARLLVVGLTTLSLHGALLQFGPFDTWRYAITLMACLGLAPLLLLSLTGADSTTARLRQRYHALSLMASNAALLCLVVCLSRMV
jgi:hypothetical protein